MKFSVKVTCFFENHQQGAGCSCCSSGGEGIGVVSTTKPQSPSSNCETGKKGRERHDTGTAPADVLLMDSTRQLMLQLSLK